MALSSAPALGQRGDTLRIGVIPALTQGQTRVGINKLGEHLSKALRRPVQVQVLSDYAAVVEGLGFGHVDMAYLGPRTFVIANHQYDAQAIVTQLVDGGSRKDSSSIRGRCTKIWIRTSSKTFGQLFSK